jgi:hypothetical protein
MIERDGFHTTFGVDSTSAKRLAPRNYYVPKWYWKRDAWDDYVGFPIWLPAMIAGAIGGWSGITAFGFRFSLRTLLIATTLVSVVLGLIVYSAGK